MENSGCIERPGGRTGKTFDVNGIESMYTYRIIKENPFNGKRAKRARTITRNRPLEIGGLYLHLGKGYPGAYRIVALLEVQEEE